MTKRERAVRNRAWLKTKVFCVTNSLKRKMTADTVLTEEPKEWLAYIQSKVIIESRENPALYVNVGAKYFERKIGRGYRQWIDYLIKKGELDENPSFRAGAGGGFTKSYRLTKTALESGVSKITFQRKQVQPPRSKPPQSTNDTALEFARKNLLKLTVTESLLQGPNAIHEAMVHEFCRRIYHGDFGLRRGANCQRLYHAVIEMPKEGRANLQLADSTEQLFEYDVKTCHPVLMFKLFTDARERDQYARLLEVDIYTAMAAAMKKALTRQEVKDDFVATVNSKERNLDALKRQWVYQFFDYSFPTFTEQVLNVRGDLALFFQNEEAKLMVDELGRFCKANDYFWVPCHDGWMGTAEHEQQIVAKVHELFHSYCGLRVAVEKLELVNRTRISLFIYSLSGSYLHGTDTSPAPSGLQKKQPVSQATVASINPWAEIVGEWRRQNDPLLLQEGAMKRAAARKRQKEGEKRSKANEEGSKRLAKRAVEAMKKLGG
jgi:hypothetical protein